MEAAKRVQTSGMDLCTVILCRCTFVYVDVTINPFPARTTQTRAIGTVTGASVSAALTWAGTIFSVEITTAF